MGLALSSFLRPPLWMRPPLATSPVDAVLPTVQMNLTLVSGAWPPRPPSPHATLVVVPGMRQTAAITRNVAQNLWRMGQVSFACVVFLYEPEQSISLDNSTSVAQACTVMRWVGRNIVDYMKLLGADVTRGFGGGVLVCMQDRVAQVTHPTIRPGRALRRRLATTV